MWTEEKLLFSSTDYYSCLLDSIRNAKKSILLESYIFLPDERGLALLELLAERASSGINVRLIIDGVGSRSWRKPQLDHWRSRGIAIRTFHPIMWPFSPKLLVYFFTRINHRDHRKVCIIDSELAYVSSFNVMDEAFGWQEMGVQVKGLEIATLEKTFEVMWDKSYSPSNLLKRFKPVKGIEKLSTDSVQFNYTKKQRKRLNERTCERIENASSKVWIITPYFVPPLALIRSLKKAKAKNVDIKIIIPDKSDVPMMPWVILYFVKIMLAANIEVYKYQPRILHAKFLLIDDWLSIGSMNLNHRSFYLDVETNVVLRLPSTLSLAHENFQELLRTCTQVKKVDVQSQNPLLALWIQFILLLRGWL